VEYVILFTKNSRKDIDKLDSVLVKKIYKKLNYLKSDPTGLSKKLVNFEQGSFRYRIGDYRVCFDIDDNKIVVNRIRHRREVYK
jgi:mRNA interferase RelE/StbE